MTDAGKAILDAPVVEQPADLVIDTLAKLSRLDYEKARAGAAKELGVRASVLDAEVEAARPATTRPDEAAGSAVMLEDPEPWPHHVDGSAILDEVVATLRRFVVMPSGSPEAAALWVAHAHAHDAAYCSPILGITSPQKRCGKTTLLSALSAVVPRALPTANATVATIFRVVEACHPTLLVDEADTFLTGDNEELRGVLNSGHTRGAAYILRTVGDAHEVRRFSTWAPKAIALIGRLPDTLTDRAVEVRLRRRLPGETVERLRLDRLAELEPLKRRIWTWAQDHLDDLRTADPEVPTALHDRAADNWRALLAVADLAGGDWPTRARKAAVSLTAGDASDDDAGVMLLEDLRDLFESRHADRLASETVVSELARLEDRPWPEWRRGRPITTRQVARLLKPFAIHPIQMKVGGKNIRGYSRAGLEDAFNRYIPGDTPFRSATTLQPNNHAKNERSASATPSKPVADGIGRKPSTGAVCSRVADETPLPLEEVVI